MRYLFKWNGEPLGFIADDGELFDLLGRCFGSVDPTDTAWRNDGHYLGELIDGQYILRNLQRFPPPPRSPRVPSEMPSELPRVVQARTPRAPIPGWIDSFDSMPEPPVAGPIYRKVLLPVAHARKNYGHDR